MNVKTAMLEWQLPLSHDLLERLFYERLHPFETLNVSSSDARYACVDVRQISRTPDRYQELERSRRKIVQPPRMSLDLDGAELSAVPSKHSEKRLLSDFERPFPGDL